MFEKLRLLSANLGPTYVRISSEYGPNMVQIWSEYGPIFRKFKNVRNGFRTEF